MSALVHNFKGGLISDNPLLAGATTINSDDFADLPAIAASDAMMLVLDPAGVDGTPELVQVTAHTASATSVTVVRGQETTLGGSTGREHADETPWVAVVSANDFLQGFLLAKSGVAKGDILVATSATTTARQAVGTDGLPLVANSGQSTGVGYAQLAAAGIASDAVTTAKILDSNVTTAKIADSAVTSAKIADGTIVAGDLASDAVTTAKILDANVTAGKLATDSVTTAKIAAGAVTAAKVAADVATQAELDALPKGLMAAAAAGGSNQSDINSTVDVTNVTVTFTAVANRKYVAKVTVGSFYYTTTNGQASFLITDSGGTALGGGVVYQTPVNTNVRSSVCFETDPFTLSAGSQTVKLRVAIASGADLVIDNVFGQSRIAVYDVGPA